MRVLLVEDDEMIGKSLLRGLIWAPTTTCSSPSSCPSCWHACARWCAAANSVIGSGSVQQWWRTDGDEPAMATSEEPGADLATRVKLYLQSLVIPESML